MKDKPAAALLYQIEGEKFVTLSAVFKEAKVKTIVVGAADLSERLGVLFGLKGFKKSEKPIEVTEDFPAELLVFNNLTGKRLDSVLKKMREAGATVTRKAVLTPTNSFWTLARLIATIEREHIESVKRK